MTPADVERLALLGGASPIRAYTLAAQHELADVRRWLRPLLVARVRALRDRFMAERFCPRCDSHDTRTVRADVNVNVDGEYLRQCNTCSNVWTPLETKP